MRLVQAGSKRICLRPLSACVAAMLTSAGTISSPGPGRWPVIVASVSRPSAQQHRRAVLDHLVTVVSRVDVPAAV